MLIKPISGERKQTAWDTSFIFKNLCAKQLKLFILYQKTSFKYTLNCTYNI